MWAWCDCNRRCPVFWVMELHDCGFPNLRVSDVDAEDFERLRTPVGGDVFNAKTPDHTFQIWWEFQMSYPQAVRFYQLMSYSIRRMSAKISAGQNERIIVAYFASWHWGCRTVLYRLQWKRTCNFFMIWWLYSVFVSGISVDVVRSDKLLFELVPLITC